MKLNTYLTYHRVLLVIQYLLFPVLGFLTFIVPLLKKRSRFERSSNSMSFNEQGIVASHCFHVSSEGELEQCLSIIIRLLREDHYIELVYTSDSVARKCTQLSNEHPRLNLLRMPLVTFPINSFRKWVTAKKFYMCRYDFFSELVLYGSRKDVTFTLLSASLKGKKLHGLRRKFMADQFRLFDLIVAASETERDRFLSLDNQLNVIAFEFRLLQISKRIEMAPDKLSEVLELSGFIEVLKTRDPLKSLVIGSAWPSELEIFRDKKVVKSVQSGELLITIAPHSLSETSILSIVSLIGEIAPELKLVRANEVSEFHPGEVYINTTPGVLLESYSFFGHALVGGGHGRSIHSVLEPYLAGCRVYCGPRVHRSTEFDFIKKQSPNDIVVINELETISDFIEGYDRGGEIDKRNNLVLSYQESFEDMMERF